MLDYVPDYGGVTRLLAAVIDFAAFDLAIAIERGRQHWEAAAFLAASTSDGSGDAAITRIRQDRAHRRRIIKAWHDRNYRCEHHRYGGKVLARYVRDVL